MAFTTTVKTLLNTALNSANIKIDSLTVDKLEAQRLLDHERMIGFDRPVYALSPGMAEFDIGPLAASAIEHAEALERLKDPAYNETGYIPCNRYYDTPDADILYLMIRRLRPGAVIEIGCGNSTRVTRQAALDGGLDTSIVAIDPSPRAEIAHLVDRFERSRVEAVPLEVFAGLRSGDVLFIDSSHEVRAGNDVAHLFCRIIPILTPGVVIHVHDIFLPYEYPKEFFFSYPSWGEQYMLHTLLSSGSFDVLWPGHYLQRGKPEVAKAIPFLSQGLAQSFWMRKIR